MCDEKKFTAVPCDVCPPRPKCDTGIDYGYKCKHFEIKITSLLVKYAEDDPPPRLTSLEYPQNYIYVRFVHPMLGRIETVPTQLKKVDDGWRACFDVEISVNVRTEPHNFWNAAKLQDMAIYVFFKNQIFDEIGGVVAVNMVQARRNEANDAITPTGGATRNFKGPMMQPSPAPHPFCRGRLNVTIGITDHGDVPHPKPPCGAPPPPLKFDAQKYFDGDLHDGICRGRANIEKFYRKMATYRPGEYDVRKEVVETVDTTNPTVNSAEMARVIDRAEDRTLVNMRRIENALAECLRNAEDIREAVTCDELARGAINRIFEHLHTMYQDTMETNIRPSDGHLSYDVLSGLEMSQKIRGLAALQKDLLDQTSRLRNYVANEKSHELECFDTAVAELNSIKVPTLMEIFNGDYHRESCRPALRESEGPVEEEAYRFCRPGPASMHTCP